MKYIFLLFFLLIEWQFLRVISLLIRRKNTPLIFKISRALSLFFTISTLLVFFVATIYPIYKWIPFWNVYFTAILFVAFIFKLNLVLFSLLSALYNAVRPARKNITSKNPIKRSEFITKLGAVVGGVPVLLLSHGMIETAYKYKLTPVNFTLKNLPPSFDGLKIIQISDIHLGSFFSTKPLEQAIEIINEQNADYIFFTGDLVNYVAEETNGYASVLSKLKSKNEILCIMGNHDYGDYANLENEAAKLENIQKMHAFYQKINWKLLHNNHHMIQRGKDQIAILGVGNISKHARFASYGNLQQALNGTEKAAVKILLSHDPSHWDMEVSQKNSEIDITLSGHTHGMQFGVEIPGIKWSPIKMLYPHWAGKYQSNNQYLYVNRGLGFIGFPGRVGIRPEITLINIQKG